MNANPMFGRTGSADFPDHLKCLVTGEPKSGKTSFLGTVPNIVILDTEPHANNLQSVAHLNLPFSTITGAGDLSRMLMVLGDASMRKQAAASLGLPSIDAVAIDTLDTLQAILKTERMRELRQTKFLRDDWGWLKEEMQQIVKAFTALPLHVFFMVHSKTKEIGTEKEPKSIILPGLEGAIAESIAGMVGYSLLSFRRQDILPDGTPKTTYYLRAEGDEVYGFLGNRAAGRLPDVIEPKFSTLLHYSVQARKQVHDGAPVTGGEIALPNTDRLAPAPVPTPAPAAQAGQNMAQQSPQAAAPQQAEQQAPQAPAAPAQAPTAPPADLPADSEPVNAAALSHVKKVYDALGLAFPEDLVLTKTLGEARTVVKMWKALAEDQAQGKGSGTPVPEEMKEFLGTLGWLPVDGGQAAPAAPTVTPDVNGTIEQVMAYVGDDLIKVVEAYNLEQRKDKPRAGLLSKLEAKGASPVQTPVQSEQPAAAAPAPEAPEPEAAPAAVTPAPAQADVPVTGEQAEATVKEVLGAEVVATQVAADDPCEQGGDHPINDIDIANLSRTRFGKWLCVDHYIQQSKA